MTNWTRFFPLLLAAHLHLGALCTAASTSGDEPEGDRSRVFSMLAVALLTWAVFAVPVLGDDRPGVVTGIVQSAETDGPLPGANVAVRRPSDSTLVGGASTDSTGHFVVEDLPTGEYTIIASFVGYESSSRRVTLTVSDPDRRLDPFRLGASQAQMRGATVSAERPFVTTEGSKRVYNVEKSQVVLAGKSAVDLFRDLPSLRVDAMDGTLRLRGNQSVSVHVNGEPVSMEGKALVQYLRGLSAADIKRIEVNTNPSARYDAEGTAGIVNIVLDQKKNAGLSGSLSASAGIGPRADGSGTLGYQQGPWTLRGSYSYSHTERDLVETLLRRRPDAPHLLLDQSITQQGAYGGHSFNAEIDYALTPATTLSLTSTGSIWDSHENQRMSIRRPDESEANTREAETDYRSVHLDERLSIGHEFGKKSHKLSADLRYQRSDQRDRVRQERTSSPSARESVTDDEQDLSFKLDYTRPLNEWTIETGYKGSVRLLDQHYELALHGEKVPAQTNALTFREQVHAGYGTLQRTIGPLDAEVGVRVEHTQTTLDQPGQAPADHQYLDLFPSASLTYEMARGRRVSLSYSKRIDRPNAYQLSAFDASNDPHVRFVGNPHLGPEQIHKAELTVMQNVGPATITVSPYVRRKTNAIEWSTVQNDSVTVRTYDNYDARTSYGAELTSSLNVGDLKATLSGNVYRRLTRGGPLAAGTSRNAFAVMGRANATWTLLDDLRLQVSQMYRSPVTAGLGRVDSFVRTSTSLEKTFWNDKATIGLQVEDPFDTSEIGLQKRTDDFREHMTRDWEGRSVSFSFSYRFGDSGPEDQRGSSSGGGGGLGPMGGG